MRQYVQYEETQLRAAFVEAASEGEAAHKLSRRMDGIEYLPEVTISGLRVVEASEIPDDIHEAGTSNSPPDTLERASIEELIQELQNRCRVLVLLGDGFPDESGFKIRTMGAPMERLGAARLLCRMVEDATALNVTDQIIS